MPSRIGEQEWAGFGPHLLVFLRDLEKHNSKDWFQSNKGRYEDHVKRPCLAFVERIAKPLARISPHLRADPRTVGGSMSRIHRDTRFSKDKRPYHSHVSLRFAHDAAPKEWGGPFVYLRLTPGGSFAAAGVKAPSPDALRLIRERIAAAPRQWERVMSKVPELEGDALKRAPAGFPPDHPLIESLKRKDFVTSIRFTDKEVAAPGFLDLAVRSFRRLEPLAGFTADALELPW